MKILNKFGFVVVFAGLALANVAGCSVDVLPAEDGGVAAEDGSTSDDVGPDDDVTPDDDAGEDGGMTGEPDGGPVTVPVDEHGNADLPECNPGQLYQQELVMSLSVDEYTGEWPDLELQAIDGEPPSHVNGRDGSGGSRMYFPADPQFRVAPSPIRLSNHSAVSVRIRFLKFYANEADANDQQNPVWEQTSYPVLGPGKTTDLGLLEKPGVEYTYTPYCTLQVRDVEE